jgi:glutamate N-acetyltransferase/amino-acid N-acetyltransferase
MKSKLITLKLGVKKNKTDGLLICLSEASTTELIFTLNKFAAAPVIISKQNIIKSNPKYIFINSGNANACTGKEGLTNTKRILNLLAKKLKCNSNEIIIMSTGIIGRQLPIEDIERSIMKNTFNNYSSLKDAACSVMTTDNHPKYLSKEYKIGSKKIIFSGLCKGAGMIEPNMATMLAFIETNVSINKSNLKKYLKYCANLSFNAISVDGDMSTNDCVAFTSTNLVKIDLKNKNNEKKLLEYAADFFIKLSSKIVKDGEGATKIIKLNICNANTKTLAQEISRKISNSLLVKTAMYGEDPNWGRIIASLGSVNKNALNVAKVKLFINKILCFDNGTPTDSGSKRLANSMKKNNIEITLDLNSGKEMQTIYFSDLSHEYVHINSAYTT